MPLESVADKKHYFHYAKLIAQFEKILYNVSIKNRGTYMQVSYDRLWKLLIDKKIKKMQLKSMAAIGTSTLAKLGRNEPVSMDVLMKICNALSCNIGDIMDVLPADGGTK